MALDIIEGEKTFDVLHFQRRDTRSQNIPVVVYFSLIS
jgi:hypothetical protein